MKLIVGAAFALGLVLGGGPTLATNLVADEVSSVDEPSPVPDDTTDPTDPADSDDSDDSTDPADSPDDAAADGPAEVNYGQVVKAWLACQGGEDTTLCGTRPHPPGVATGFDAAHSEDHAHAKAENVKPEHATSEHGHGTAKAAHGKSARH